MQFIQIYRRYDVDIIVPTQLTKGLSSPASIDNRTRQLNAHSPEQAPHLSDIESRLYSIHVKVRCIVSFLSGKVTVSTMLWLRVFITASMSNLLAMPSETRDAAEVWKASGE